MEAVSLIISIAALLVSLVTFWLTRLRKGTIKMTKPTVIFFGPDKSTDNKVFIRTLLYSTSDKGQYVENMYVRLIQRRDTQDFNVWVYGSPDSLARGSGLSVGKRGLATNHHFLLQKNTNYRFKAGDYRLEVYAELVRRKPQKIYTQQLSITKGEAKALASEEAGIYFDWAPNLQTYQSFIDRKSSKPANMKRLLKQLEE